MQHTLQLIPGEGTEIGQRELAHQPPEEHEEEQRHGDPSAEGGGDGRPLHTQSREAKVAEDERIVAEYVQDIDHERHLHGIVGLIGRTEHG